MVEILHVVKIGRFVYFCIDGGIAAPGVFAGTEVSGLRGMHYRVVRQQFSQLVMKIYHPSFTPTRKEGLTVLPTYVCPVKRILQDECSETVCKVLPTVSERGGFFLGAKGAD